MPAYVALRRFPTSPRRYVRRLWWWALAMSSAYVSVFLLAAFCLATGSLHGAPSAEVPGHTHHPPTHQHHAQAPDICTVVLQALMATALPLTPAPARALMRHACLTLPSPACAPQLVRVQQTTRAPPLRTS